VAAYPLQLELTGRLDLHQHSRTNKDLPDLASSHSRKPTFDTVPMAGGVGRSCEYDAAVREKIIK
jgi:hypothetical protein